jgi:hypothetical protein
MPGVMPTRFHLAATPGKSRLLLPVLLSCLMAGPVLATTYTVSNTANSGAGSLRQAILDANASAATPHLIQFNIAGTGLKSIALTSALPVVGRNTTIDGTTQPGYSGVPRIELNGTSAGAASSGLVVTGASLIVKGLAINRFALDGLCSQPAEDKPAELEVYGCYIGTAASGLSAAPNGRHGIHFAHFSGASDGSTHRVGDAGTGLRNVISGNGADGIHVHPSVWAGVIVCNNLIGLGADGLQDVGNGGDGIEAVPHSEVTTIEFFPGEFSTYHKGTFIGRETPGTGNVISCNGESGIELPAISSSLARSVPIFRNLIGTDATGTLARGNGTNGISIGAGADATIGKAGAGNVIAGNDGSGVYSLGELVEVVGNTIGTNTIQGALGNGIHGIRCESATLLTVTGNIVGHNGLHGIAVLGATGRYFLHDNRIGITPTGADIGNLGDGIYVAAYDPNYSGWTPPGGWIAPLDGLPGNTVAHNGGAGIRVLSPTRNCWIAENSIRDNGGLGIDLGTSGPTVNDPLDADSGGNGLQNFPVLTLATPTRVAGTLHSVPSLRYRIHVYTAAADPSGHGEGAVLLGSLETDTDASGNASFLLGGLALPAGSAVTATATPLHALVSAPFPPHDTSEFAASRTVSGGDTGDFGFSLAGASVSESAGTATLTVNRTGGTTGGVSVAYAVTGGSATAGTDFTATSGTLNFTHGQASRTIVVPIADDAADEPDETFTVTLSNPQGGALITGTATSTVTIADNDNPPVLAIGDAAMAEGNVGTGTLSFTVSLSAASSFPVTVNHATANQTATAGIDYLASAGTLTFEPGETTKALAITVNGDLTVETDETFSVSLTAPANATLGDAAATGGILDDDHAGTLAFATANYSVAEVMESKMLTVTRSNGSAGTVTIPFAITGGTATAGEDYTSFHQSGTLTFLDGQASRGIAIGLLDDILIEGDETLVVTLGAPTGGALPGALTTTTLTIVDDDTAPIVRGRVLKDDGSALANATVTLSGDRSATVTSDWNGHYAFPDLVVGESYSVTVTHDGWSFAPPTRDYPALDNSREDENFTATPEEQLPQLQLTLGGDGTVTLKWPAAATGWQLQKSLTLAAGSWVAVEDEPAVDGEWQSVTLPALEPSAFFRLSN